MSHLIALRVPGTENTLRAISERLERGYVRRALDDSLYTAFGAWKLFSLIASGQWRVYGVFELSDSDELLGLPCLGFGEFKAQECAFYAHTVADRAAPVLQCYRMLVQAMKKDFADDGIQVDTLVGTIPEKNRASAIAALRLGMTRGEVMPDEVFRKNNMRLPVRKYTLDIREF